MKHKVFLVALCIPMFLFFCSLTCEGPSQPEYGADNPDPNPTGLAAPTVNSMDPTQGYLKDVVTINGSGFNATTDFNFVAFGEKRATVLSATTSALTVEAPNLADVTVGVKVAIKGSEFWSDPVDFTFKPTLAMIDDEISWPNGVAVDAEENVYIGSVNDGVIYKITSAGVKSTFATVDVNGSIHFVPDNYLYVCGKESDKIWKVSPDGATVEEVCDINSPVDFDFDENLNMYIGASGGLHKLAAGSTTPTQVADVGSRKSERIFNNQIYVTSIWNDEIWRFDITAGGLENGEMIWDLNNPCALEIDSEGNLIASSAWETTLFILKPDGTEETMYDDALMTPMRYFSMYGKVLYMVYPGWADIGEVMSAYIGVEQAPRFGVN